MLIMPESVFPREKRKQNTSGFKTIFKKDTTKQKQNTSDLQSMG